MTRHARGTLRSLRCNKYAIAARISYLCGILGSSISDDGILSHACSAWQGFRHEAPPASGIQSINPTEGAHLSSAIEEGECRGYHACDVHDSGWKDVLDRLFMSPPSGTAQAEEVKLRKTCRGCKQPLYGGSQDGALSGGRHRHHAP